MSWTKEKFLSVLSDAHKAEKTWVDSARASGAAVAHGRKIVLPKHDPRKDFCPTPDAVALVQLEIKVRSIKFTSPSDFPYPTVFVDDANGLSKGPEPFAWVFVSKPTGAWVWASCLDRDDQWVFQDVYDTMRGFTCKTLVAPSCCLRPADQLLRMLFAGEGLQYVEGEMGAFRGEERAPDKCDPSPPRGGRKAKKNPG
jgi:hypothetical protein